MKKLIAVAALFLLSSVPAQAQGIGEIFEGALMPQVVGGISYDKDAVGQKWQAILTANIMGPKLGSIPCYISGVGVALNTVAPGLEDAPIAAASVPLLTCLPFSDRVSIQTGFSISLQGGARTPYVGVGIAIGDTPAQAKVKRVRRIQEKAKKKAELSQGPPAPAS